MNQVCAKIGEKVSEKIPRVKGLDLLAKRLNEREMPHNVSLASKISFAHFFPKAETRDKATKLMMIEVITVIR